jgi:hypothetical protein
MILWFRAASQTFMPHHFKADARSFGDLFIGNEKQPLIVPPFQRGYSWGKRHVDDFLDDLGDFMTEKREGRSTHYFLGPIVILEKEDAPSLILDGQQRLATATIMFAALRDAANEIGTAELLKFAAAVHTSFLVKDDAGDELGYTLTLGNLDKFYFQSLVQKFPTEEAKDDIVSNSNIRRAKAIIGDYVKGQIKGMSAGDVLVRLKQIRDTVRKHLIMTYIPVDNENEAFQIFETLNDRGLGLSAPDLLLNHLMKTAQESERVDIRNAWDKMTETMAQRKTADFLRAVWVSEFGDLKKKDLFKALKEHLSNTQADSLTYARRCAEMCETYNSILEFDEKTLGPATRHVQTLLRPLGCDAAIPLLMSACVTMSHDGLSKLCERLIVFVVRYAVIAGMNTAVMESLFFALAKMVRASMKGDEAERQKKEPECLKAIESALRKECPADDKIKSSIKTLNVPPRSAFYIIKTIADHAQSDRKEIGSKKANVEHIFPRNPSAEWTNSEELKPYLWHLGNLTLLGDKINSKDASNKGYESKKDAYELSKIDLTNTIPKYYPTWEPKTLLSRADQMGGRILEIWNFENFSRL